AVSALPLIGRLLDDDTRRRVLVTTGTVTSARLLGERLPQRAFHQFAPLDRAAWVRRFLDHWRPDLALWMESELWPNLVGETGPGAIPMVRVTAACRRAPSPAGAGRRAWRAACWAAWRWCWRKARRTATGSRGSAPSAPNVRAISNS